MIYSIKWFDRIKKTITISKRILNIQQLRLPDMRKSDAQRWTLNLYTSNFRQTIFAREAMLRSTGTGYPAINADDLAEIPIWIPPLDQQEKIGAALSFLGAKIEVHQKLLSALCTVKSSLLQQLFI